MISGTFRAVVTAAAAAGIGITAFGDRYLLVLTVAGIAFLFALGWPTLLGLPARGGALVVLALIGAAAIATLLRWVGLLYAAVVVGLGAVAAFVRALPRPGGRPRALRYVSGLATGGLVTGWT